MRGQMSLEFIVKLLIILVVAAAVIGMFLKMFSGQDLDVAGTDQLKSEQEIRTACQQTCDRWKRASGLEASAAAVEYCTQRFVYDADGDGQVMGDTAGAGHSTYCQDGVTCFNVHECEYRFDTLNAETCQEIMCNYFQNPEVVNDPSAADAGQRVYDAFEQGVDADEDRGSGTCDLENIEDAAGNPLNTWWQEYYSSTDICQ